MMTRQIAMRNLFAFLLLLGVPAVSAADDGDDTLRYYLSKSDLVVLGEIVSQPFGVMGELGVVNYLCDFKVEQLLKGKRPPGEELKVNIVRFESHKDDKFPGLRKGGRFILFLKDMRPAKRIPPWETADVWFGIQHPSPKMARSLARLAREGPVKDK
jgi:hypothetical protein